VQAVVPDPLMASQDDVLRVRPGPTSGLVTKPGPDRSGRAPDEAGHVSHEALAHDDNGRPRAGSHALVSVDPAMVLILGRAEQIAWSDASVLIQGESGTGKEVLARHIHRHSRRSNGAFVALNCAAIPEHLLESELFGHEKGAFSGAIGRRVGKFEAAQGGTILLDEISEMDSRLQAKLLRALQEREVDRLGGTSPIKIDVRVIAITNKDLWEEVGKKTFREDLFFRLNVAPLHIPPLRQRPADIDALSDHFVRKYALQNSLPVPSYSSTARDLLRSYNWPGNVRELENIIHRAVILMAGGVLSVDALDLHPGYAARRQLPPVERTRAPAGFVARSLGQVEQDLIVATLGYTKGNRTHAATILGISIRALRNKLRDYTAQGIDVPAPTPPGTA